MSQSLDRGIEILFLLKQKTSATITEMAEELGVHKSTVSRLMSTLRAHDLVQVDPATKQYRLGFRLLYLGENLSKNAQMMALARPFLFRLSAELRESVHLCTFNNRMVYVVDQVRSSKEYSLPATPGMVEPAHASSVGKCIFAYKSEGFVRKYLKENGMQNYTDRTITCPDTFVHHLAEIRDQGYAVDNEEVTLGVCCVAAPLFGPRGDVQFSIGASGPADDFPMSRLKAFAKHLVQAGRAISAAMAHQARQWPCK